MREQKEELEDMVNTNNELETDLRNLKNERDSITASLQLALTKADSQQLLRKIAEDQVAYPLCLAAFLIILRCHMLARVLVHVLARVLACVLVECWRVCWCVLPSGKATRHATLYSQVQTLSACTTRTVPMLHTWLLYV